MIKSFVFLYVHEHAALAVPLVCLFDIVTNVRVYNMWVHIRVVDLMIISVI